MNTKVREVRARIKYFGGFVETTTFVSHLTLAQYVSSHGVEKFSVIESKIDKWTRKYKKWRNANK